MEHIIYRITINRNVVVLDPSLYRPFVKFLRCHSLVLFVNFPPADYFATAEYSISRKPVPKFYVV